MRQSSILARENWGKMRKKISRVTWATLFGGVCAALAATGTPASATTPATVTAGAPVPAGCSFGGAFGHVWTFTRDHLDYAWSQTGILLSRTPDVEIQLRQ